MQQTRGNHVIKLNQKKAWDKKVKPFQHAGLRAYRQKPKKKRHLHRMQKQKPLAYRKIRAFIIAHHQQNLSKVYQRPSNSAACKKLQSENTAIATKFHEIQKGRQLMIFQTSLTMLSKHGIKTRAMSTLSRKYGALIGPKGIRSLWCLYFFAVLI